MNRSNVIIQNATIIGAIQQNTKWNIAPYAVTFAISGSNLSGKD